MNLRTSNLRGLYRMCRSWGLGRVASLRCAWLAAVWCDGETKAWRR